MLPLSWNDPIVGFLIGIAAGLGLVGLWRGIRLWLDSRATKAAVSKHFTLQSYDSRNDKAHERVDACRKRLLLQKKLNPEWITPLVQEVPKLVHEIAEIYYPNAKDPLRAPGPSHFTRAIHLAAMDLADFLQNRRVGRLIDVSMNTAWKSWEVGKKISNNKKIKILNKLYRWAHPALQAWRYKSPVMWTLLAASNIAIRTLQPAVINIVARRAIELYSGQLVLNDSKNGKFR